MDGALNLDKPKGISSHDAVAAARRLLREKRIGHAGTLDPMATGVLVLLCGRATRPAFSAKKVEGRRAYDLARRQQAVELQPVPVTVSRIQVTAFEGRHLTVVLTCSAGFYVRSFAHQLGQLVGTGACLEELRRTRSGDFPIEDAVSLADAAAAEDLASRLVPMDHLLKALPARAVTAEGRQRVAHGRELTAAQLFEPAGSGVESGRSTETTSAGGWVRLLDSEGRLIALGRTTGTTLHPSIVLI